MAEIIDERLEVNNEDGVEFASLDAQPDGVVEETVAPQVEVQQQPEEDDLPEKYRGKSAKEIARMHQEAEKMMGKHSSEVGELRSIVDSFIKTQLATSQPTAQQPVAEVDDLDFYTDPKSAVKKALDSHPAIRQAQEFAAKSQRAEAQARVYSRHPDAKEIASNPEFIEWVGKSVVRQNLFALADRQFDPVAADELLTTWKERKGMVDSAKQVAQQDRKQALKGANVGSGSVRGSAESVSKKVYRRADIINLLQTNPDRYYAMADEIQKAYSEGRVR